jgi:uncharacterized protein (TIGR02172 family)
MGANMQKGNLIGQGNTAEIYCWGDKEILKLFRKEFPKQGVEKEFLVSKEVQESGLPVPKVGKMIEDEGRNGIIYERIYGDSMLKRLSQKPWTISKEAKRLAELHYRIHQCTIQSVPKQKEEVEWNIKKTELLSDKKKQKILNILKKLPDGRVLCHGDFHPGNVIMESNKAVVLDWMTATSGNAAADVARTLLLLKDSALPSEMPFPVRLILTFIRYRLYSVYLKRYIELSSVSLNEVRQWEVPVAAARLTEWVPKSEKEHLLELIDKSIM